MISGSQRSPSPRCSRESPDVGKATRERVKKRMRELDYQPNYQARALAGGKTYSIGLIVPDLVRPFFAEVAKRPRLRRTGKRPASSCSAPQKKILLWNGRRSMHCCSAAWMPSCSHPASLVCNPIALRGKPMRACVLVDRDFPEQKLRYVGSDDYRVGTLAMEHLLSIGRRRIAHIGSEAASTGRARLRAYRDAMQASRLRVPESFLIVKEQLEDGGDQVGYEAMRRLLKQRRPPDAVFCYNDTTAMGAIASTLAAGLRIPQDVAFVGCGNFRYADHLRVPLTSVEQCAQSMGTVAGRLALDLIGGRGPAGARDPAPAVAGDPRKQRLAFSHTPRTPAMQGMAFPSGEAILQQTPAQPIQERLEPAEQKRSRALLPPARSICYVTGNVSSGASLIVS